MDDAPSPRPLVVGGRFDEFVPIEVLERGRERFVIRTRFDAGHLNAAGMVHGGFIAAFLDIAIAGGGASALGRADRYGITLTLTVHFVAPVPEGPVWAVATSPGGGRRTRFVEAHLHGGEGPGSGPDPELPVLASATGTVRVVELPEHPARAEAGS